MCVCVYVITCKLFSVRSCYLFELNLSCLRADSNFRFYQTYNNLYLRFRLKRKAINSLTRRRYTERAFQDNTNHRDMTCTHTLMNRKQNVDFILNSSFVKILDVFDTHTNEQSTTKRSYTKRTWLDEWGTRREKMG